MKLMSLDWKDGDGMGCYSAHPPKNCDVIHFGIDFATNYKRKKNENIIFFQFFIYGTKNYFCVLFSLKN